MMFNICVFLNHPGLWVSSMEFETQVMPQVGMKAVNAGSHHQNRKQKVVSANKISLICLGVTCNP